MTGKGSLRVEIKNGPMVVVFGDGLTTEEAVSHVCGYLPAVPMRQETTPDKPNVPYYQTPQAEIERLKDRVAKLSHDLEQAHATLADLLDEDHA